jgi:hypothetical protein
MDFFIAVGVGYDVIWGAVMLLVLMGWGYMELPEPLKTEYRSRRIRGFA